MSRKKSSDFIDIKGLCRQYLSHWYLFIISIVLCLGVTFLYLRVKKPQYAVRANVLISQEDGGNSGLTMIGAAMPPVMGDLFGSNGYVEDEIFIISSHSLYRDVVRELQTNITYNVRKGFLKSEMAYPQHPVNVTPAAGMLDTLQTSISFKLKVDKEGKADITAKMEGSKVAQVKDVTLPYSLETPLGLFSFAKTETYPAGESVTTNINVSGYDEAAEALAENVSAEIASKRSNVIALSIDTPNPKYGMAVLNAIIAYYNKRGINEKAIQNETTLKFIEDRLVLLGDEIAKAETEIQSYKQHEGIIDVEIEAKYQTEKRAHVEQELINAQTQQAVIKMSSDFIDNPANEFSPIPITIDNEGLSRSIQAYNELLQLRERMSHKVSPDNKAMRDNLNDIRVARSSIKESFDKAYQTASVTVRDLQKQLNSTSGSLSNIPQQEREYINLFRENSVKSNLYIYLLQRREETAMMQANATPKGVIVDEAFTLSEPLGMKRKFILLIGLLMGFMLPPVYLYFRRLIYNRFETRTDVERVTEVPILGEICTDNSGSAIIATAKNTNPSAELFRLLRSNLLFILNTSKEKVVLLTSSSSGEGKTYISINLAAALALVKKKVLLVGMDIRNPRLSEYLDIHPKCGLTQYLSSDSVPLSSIITSIPEVPNLDVIVAGPVPPNPGELLLSDKVDALFNSLRDDYDFIVVDTAPIGLVSDTFTLDRIADATIYVCRANYTSLADLSEINEVYEQKRLKKLSIVVNGTPVKKSYGYHTREEKN